MHNGDDLQKKRDDRKAKKGTDGKGGYDAEFRGFINLALNDDEKAAFEVWSSSDGLLEALSWQVRDGVVVSVKFDQRQGCFVGSATQRKEASVNAGLAVTARGKSPETALFRVVYSLVILSRAESWEETQPLADPDRW